MSRIPPYWRICWGSSGWGSEGLLLSPQGHRLRLGRWEEQEEWWWWWWWDDDDEEEEE